MKKTYIAPETQEHKIKIESLLDSASTNNLNQSEAGEGTEDNPANFSRGLVWELEEINDEE